MKLVTANIHDRTFIGLIFNEDSVIDIQKAELKLYESEISPASLQACIEMGEKFVRHIEALQEWVAKEKERETYVYPLSAVKLQAPIPRPKKNIMCVGKNYRDHVAEMGSESDIPSDLILFSKPSTSVIAHEGEIDPHLYLTDELDYEGELAVVIGKKGKQIREEEAYDYVFGYTIINDVTARDLQARHKQYFLGKSLDTSCPMGPYIVHKSAVSNPQHLSIETKVNGEIRQQANTSQMIFPIKRIISIISQGMTLEPGDIIATGTPAGVGKGFNPPKLLKPGDTVEITVEGIGTLRNKVKEI
ncbi:MAG: hypothetical protein C6W58_00900 [Bacillaceae bacterium]|uniref:fumarylacetoacetate hydrolase family protein n=1 Tax=Aeribacillus sp. FSL k6-2211 TaxID=2954608 RepID=UPI000E38DDC2|nr:MAG: hypothetical protein C6W58_00900 [Bacillaceae bacterium]